VEARDFVLISRRSSKVTLSVTVAVAVQESIYPSDITTWAALKGCRIESGEIFLWKAVRADGTDFHSGKISYLGEAIAPDWDPDYPDECGKALHLSDAPSGARVFVPEEQRESFRLLEVAAKVEDCRCFPGQPQYPMKLRARACRFVREVPRDYKSDVARSADPIGF